MIDKQVVAWMADRSTDTALFSQQKTLESQARPTIQSSQSQKVRFQEDSPDARGAARSRTPSNPQPTANRLGGPFRRAPSTGGTQVLSITAFASGLISFSSTDAGWMGQDGSGWRVVETDVPDGAGRRVQGAPTIESCLVPRGRANSGV